jgi:hypothetical protein
MNNYFFKFLVLFVIVLTFLYVISNTKEFFSDFQSCDLILNSFIDKDGSCLPINDTPHNINKKKIDLLYQHNVIKDTDINAPNSHNIVFQTIVKDGDVFNLNGQKSMIYIPNFSSSILFAEIKLSTNSVEKNQSIIGSNDWSIDIKNSNIILKKKSYYQRYILEYILKYNIEPFTEYTLFIKCNNNLIEVYIDGEKKQRQGVYNTKSIFIGSNIKKNNFFFGNLSNIVLFNYKPESSDLITLETGGKLLPEKVEVIARSENRSIELNWLVTNTISRKTTDFYIIMYENNVGPKIIKYKNRQCENCKYTLINLNNFTIYKLGVLGVNEFGIGEVSNLVQISPGLPLNKLNIPTKAQKIICLNNGLYETSNRCKVNTEVMPNFTEESYNYILDKLNEGKNKSFNLNLGE